MNSVYDILEICLAEVENGTDPETVLARYPDHAEELRPILQAAIDAKRMAVPAPSSDVLRRNRAKLLQRAAQLREGQPTVTNRWFPSLQRLALALVLLIVFFVSGTRLVRASSSALPGDSLYSVKRSWEDVALFFTFDSQAHETLQIEYENERLEEISELFANGRPAEVDFVGIVTRQNGDEWRVANISVVISAQTDLTDQLVNVGAAVRVTGTTNGDSVVYAKQIELLPASAPVPEVKDDESELEADQFQTTSQPSNENSGSGSETEAPEIEGTDTPSPEPTPRVESFEGILNSITGDVWKIGNVFVNVVNAEIKGVPVIGALVKAEGYYSTDGSFVALKIEIINSGSGNDNSNSNADDDGSTNTNSNNDNGDDDNNNTNSDNGGDDSNTNSNSGNGG